MGLARAVAVADSEAAHTPAPPASQGPPPLVHHPTIAAAGGAPKRAGPPMCAYHPGNEQRLGRVVSGRLGPDGVTELVTVRLEGAGAMVEALCVIGDGEAVPAGRKLHGVSVPLVS